MKQKTIDEMIGKTVGYVIHNGQAIDFTPIINFVLTKPLQPGDLLEWDNANNNLVYKGNNTRRSKYMKAPEYIIIINDWFTFKSENGSPEGSIKEAIDRWDAFKVEIHVEFRKADDEQKKMFDHATMNEPISSIKVIDVTTPYEKIKS